MKITGGIQFKKGENLPKKMTDVLKNTAIKLPFSAEGMTISNPALKGFRFKFKGEKDILTLGEDKKLTKE